MFSGSQLARLFFSFLFANMPSTCSLFISFDSVVTEVIRFSRLQLGVFSSRSRPITCISMGRGRFARNHGLGVPVVFWFGFVE